MIAMAEKNGKNKELLIMKNADKTAIAEIPKMSSVIDLENKDS